MVVGRRDTLSLTVDTLHGEVRTLQTDLARLKDTVNSMSEVVYANHYSERARTEHTVVYTSRQYSVLPQDMARLANGDLVVSFREGPEHTVGFSPEINGRITLVRSTDEARTWSEPTIVYERDREDNLDPTITQLGSGTVLLHWIHSDRYDRSGMLNPPEGRQFYVKTLRSEDGGETWGKPLILRQDFPNWDNGYASSVEMAGTTIFTTYYYQMFSRYYVGGTFWELPG